MNNIKTLKIGFAMGGGVSLGSFSGAALTESIKQLIVYGGYKDQQGDWKNYDKIEIDVFSGASAGAVSLAIMLRIFFHYEDKLDLLFGSPSFPDCKDKETLLEAICTKLKTQFGAAFDQLDAARRGQLISAQIVQEFQQHLWVNEADISPMAGIKPEGNKNLNHLGSILDRNHLQNLAQQSLLFDEMPKTTGRNNLLAKRVLFANTLTRIEHEKISSGKHFAKTNSTDEDEQTRKLEALYAHILQDGTTSYSHKDIRVFDINFTRLKLDAKTKNKLPVRWMKYHLGKAIPGTAKILSRDGKSEQINYELQSIQDNRFWASIAATAMAAGAFPVAFEQVPLKRYAYEYGVKEFNITGEAQAEHIFSYIDGGTFNNEPISEAFRLSSFIDAMDKGTAGKDYERMLIYVDPLIGSCENEIKDYYREFKTNEARARTSKRNGAEKMLSFVPAMINILRHQGSVVEMDKSIDVHNLFSIQKQLRQFYATTVRLGLMKNIKDQPEEEQETIRTEIKQTIAQVHNGLRELQTRVTIPSVSLEIPEAIKRLINQKGSDNYYPKIKSRKNLKIEDIAGYREFFKGDPLKAANFEEWLIALFHIALDIGLDLTGKNEYTKLIPIGPIEVVNGNFHDIELAGKRMSGFFGFLDSEIRRADFEMGRYCTIDLMKHVQLLHENAPEAQREKFEFDDEKIKETLKAVFEKRLKQELYLHNLSDMMNFGGSGPVDSTADAIRTFLVQGGRLYINKKINDIIERLDTPESIPVEFRIQIPVDKNFHLADANNSVWVSDIGPQENLINGKSKIISTVMYTNQFNSLYIKDGKINIVRGNEFLSKIPIAKEFKDIVATVPLPRADLQKHMRSYSYPIFKLDLSEKLKDEASVQQFNYELENFPDKEWWLLESGIDSLDNTLLKYHEAQLSTQIPNKINPDTNKEENDQRNGKDDKRKPQA